jgi:hypothetical protein
MLSEVQLLAQLRIFLKDNQIIFDIVKPVVKAQELIGLLQNFLRDSLVVLLVVLDDL